MTGIHSGDIGDVIYGIPAFREAGVNVVMLNPSAAWGTSMGQPQCEALAPLLVNNGIGARMFTGRAEGDVVSLDEFRAGLQDLTYTHLGLSQAKQLGVTVDLSRPFLEADPIPAAEVIIHRSARYHNPAFFWQMLLEDVGDVMALGSREDVFCLSRACGRELKHYRTDDFHEVARVIAGAKAFIGNQSAPFAVAEGLKVNRVQETFWGIPNAIPQSHNGLAVQTVEQLIHARQKLLEWLEVPNEARD